MPYRIRTEVAETVEDSQGNIVSERHISGVTSRGIRLRGLQESHFAVVGRFTEDIDPQEKEEHPLEEVFAKVKAPFSSVVKNNPGVKAEYAFRLVVGSPPSLGNVREAVGWCAVTMGGKGQYPKLDDCLAAAVEQATKGKGQRHGGDKTPFLEQPWVRLYKTHGLGFLLGQADKKYHEALGKEKEDDMVREFLGAIVYLGMALLVLEGKVK